MILADTSVWIDFLNGEDTPERHALHRLIEDEEDIALTEIVLTEVLQGIKEDKDFKKVRDYLLAFPIVGPTDIQTYLNAAGIYRACRKKGKTVRTTVDCIIAAICIEHGLSLLHRDTDFELIASFTGLKCFKV
jgi:predicted nucleic acid-binding protein